MLMPHNVCITQQSMMKTMMVMIIMSLLKQCRMIELSFCASYNDLCRINGVFDKFYSKSAFENTHIRRNVFLTLWISILLVGLSF